MFLIPQLKLSWDGMSPYRLVPLFSLLARALLDAEALLHGRLIICCLLAWFQLESFGRVLWSRLPRLYNALLGD